MQNLDCLVLTCTWHFEIQKYLVLTYTWMHSTWYLSKYFQILLSNEHVYSGLNLEYVFFNKSPLNTIMIIYWNGSYGVLTAWGLQTSWLDCLPWSAGQEYLKSFAHGRWGCNLQLLSHPNVGWLYVLDDPSVTLTQGHGCDIDKQKFACLQGKVKTTQPITAKLSSDIPLVMIITWLDFWGNLLETIILPNFLRKFWMCFFKVKHSRTYLRNDWSD